MDWGQEACASFPEPGCGGTVTHYQREDSRIDGKRLTPTSPIDPPEVILVHPLVQRIPVETHVRSTNPLNLEIPLFEVARLEREVGIAQNALTDVVQAVLDVAHIRANHFGERTVDHA